MQPAPSLKHERRNLTVGGEPTASVSARHEAAGSDDAVDLRANIATVAGLQAPVRRVLTVLAGHWIETSGWNRLGFARLGDYAAERLGVSARTLQDWAYVDRAFAKLPRLDAALSNGSIGWTQARLLARVATADDEHRWIARARCMTARSLEKEVRRVDQGSLEAGAAQIDRGDPGNGLESREAVRIRCTPFVRARWSRARQAANRVSGERLPVWAAMDAVAAEVSSWLAPQPDPVRLGFESTRAVVHRAQIRPRRNATTHPEIAVPCIESLPDNLRSLLEGLEYADARSLDSRLRRAITMEQRIVARLAPLLLQVAERRRFRTWGFPSFAAYVRECLPMSVRRARALLRIERACRACPALHDAYRSAEISWVQAQALVPLALAPNAPHRSWITWARGVSVRRLEHDVDCATERYAIDGSHFPDPPGPNASNDRSADRAVDELEVQTRARPSASKETAAPFWSAPRDAARFFRAVLCSVRLKLERDRPGRRITEGEAFGAMLDHALEAWGAGAPKIKRSHRVFARDGWRCTAPGCTSYRNLHDHHIRFRSAGGSDELSNRTTLCAWHHQRGVHAGIVSCTGNAPDALRFELGVEPGREPWRVYASGDVVLRQRALISCNVEKKISGISDV